MKLGAVVLAAGLSRRFGENKLLVGIENKPMVGIAVDAAQAAGADEVAAVVSDDAVKAYMCSRGVRVILNEAPELGQAHSIALAARAMRGMDALLLIAGDMPLLTGGSVRSLVQAYKESGRGLACLQDETHYGNPAVFSSAYFEQLLSLDGDRGAKRILKANEADLLRVRCLHAGELADADHPQALVDILNRGDKG